MSIQQNIKVASDAVIFGYDETGLYLLLIERKKATNGKSWAVPGGFVEDKETPEQAAIRELKEETGVKVNFAKQFHSFGEVKRDPRFRVISIAHYLLVKKNNHQPKGNDDAKSAQWISAKSIPELAFDHNEMVEMALEELKKSISSLNIDCIDDNPTLEDVKVIAKAIKNAQKRNRK